MSVRVATELFAAARREFNQCGVHRCFFCLAPCNESFRSGDFVKKSFTGRDTVGGGDWICGGCVAALNEKATVRQADGTTRTKQKIRTYSWVLTKTTATAATKSHLAWLLQQCLDPPEPPFAIVLSDSGQKHLLYRGLVSHSRYTITVTLEGVPVTYSPDELQSRLAVCKQVAAALGKPALGGSLRPTQLGKLIEYHADTSLPDRWLSVRELPLTSLATWFTPGKKECTIEYPSNAAR